MLLYGRRKKSELNEYKFYPTEHLWICSSGVALAVSMIPHALDYINSDFLGYSKNTMYAT